MANVSNTKLTTAQKNYLKAMRVAQAGKTAMAQSLDATFTVLVGIPFRNANTVLVYTSIGSPNEKKYRAKVGEFNARRRLDQAEGYIIWPKPYDIEQLAIDILELMESSTG